MKQNLYLDGTRKKTILLQRLSLVLEMNLCILVSFFASRFYVFSRIFSAAKRTVKGKILFLCMLI